ncbi:MAG: right-handed parallel beta-helix repeat-containing protein [Oscillospiraceae bacterium]|jgi:hypothetical protein|nr:right-handed parallel beta-helix repeat-containing protein [Oscillospiraceae bacterium]
MAHIYHVSKTGSDTNAGGKESPFLTIGAAANIAQAGDTIIVHAGEYREWVKPRHGGRSNARRITYQAAEGERVVIKGSERIRHWQRVAGAVWQATLPNSLFGAHNPYRETVTGDWLAYPVGRSVHLGDVYLNGLSFYEAESLEALQKPVMRTEVLDDWTEEVVPIHNPEQTKYLWFAEVGAEETNIYANFNGADPNQELTEINVRRCCFYPEATGIHYITVRGFEMAQAATPWAPPTGDQPGLIGPHWSKGWIIENNVIHDAKCSAISIGKEASTGDNHRTFRKDKPGYQYQLESVFAARRIGWSKETVGSHIVRNNTIYDCGQNGVVGHLGCVFSEIYRNHIYRIGLKREFYGYEIAGIKLHAAIDVQIHHNHVHDCSLGTWLDWQAQGARVSKNLYYQNKRDLFIEVSHGPYLVDYNIFASKYAIDNHAQGGAYVHNLIAGKIVLSKMLNRATPYHVPHSTDVAGYAMVYGADDRLYQNLFIGGGTSETVGTSGYNGCSVSLEEYIARVDSRHAKAPGDLDLFEAEEQPAYVGQNAYVGGAKAFDRETEKLDRADFDAALEIERSKDGVYLCCTLPEAFDTFVSEPKTSQALGRVRIVDADFENPDGSTFVLDSDILDIPVAGKSVAGPCGCLKAGKNRVKIRGMMS